MLGFARGCGPAFHGSLRPRPRGVFFACLLKSVDVRGDSFERDLKRSTLSKKKGIELMGVL